MSTANVYVPINSSILVLIEEIKNYMEMQLFIQATQQDILENTIVFYVFNIDN